MDNEKVISDLKKMLQGYMDIEEDKMEEIVQKLPLKMFKKKSVLLHQGEASDYCMFVLSGCLRQYRVNEEGNEVTSEFYEEGQWVNVFNESLTDKVSRYSLSCSEDCLLIYSQVDNKGTMFMEYPALVEMTTKMLTEKIGQVNELNYGFAALSPEERVRVLIRERPSLIKRVPQHQLASYLGITPEAFSRIKKRI